MGDTPLVLLHGWGMTPGIWNGLRICLSPHMPRIPALPGHAGAAPAEAVLRAWGGMLLKELPERFVLCGWSLGAMVALDLAHRHPDRIARLVLIGATPRFVSLAAPQNDDAWPYGIAPQTMSGFIDNFASDPDATLRRFLALQTVGESRRRGVVHALGRAISSIETADRTGLADGLRLLADSDLRDVAGRIRQPTTLIHGRNDALIPVAAAEWLASAMPDARLTIFDDCGHVPFVSQPEACARLIEEAWHG